MNCGKSATIFHETAEELGNIILTNKIFQKTRFVRSLQRGNTAALRNLPTIINVIGKEFNDATLNGDATKSNLIKKTLDELMDAKNLFFAIGVSQLLEKYCEASLESQYSTHFPTQVCTFFMPFYQSHFIIFMLFLLNFVLFKFGNEWTLY